MASILPIVLILLIAYVLLIRPQQQRVRRQREMVQSLQVGSRVQTIGGIIGHIVDLDAQHIHLEVAPGIVMTFARAAVANVLQSPDAEEDDEADEGYDDEEHESGEGEVGGDGYHGLDQHPGEEQATDRDEPHQAGSGGTAEPTSRNGPTPHDTPAPEAGNRPLGAGEESDEGRP